MRWKKTITVVGAHAEGEVGNVVTGGIVDVPGRTMFEKMQYMEKNADDIRKILLFEPRGAPYISTNVILPSTHPEADFGFLVMSATEYSPMSGSNAMCVATVALETGMVLMQEPVTRLIMEAPAGLITVECTCRNGKVEQVTLKNIPCFPLYLDTEIDVDGIGRVKVDVAYGGIFYAIAHHADVGAVLTAENAAKLCELGLKVKKACNDQLEIVHPENPDIKDVSNVVLAGDIKETDQGQFETQSATVVLQGRLDRSACGTGTSARLACLYAKGQINVNQVLSNRSVIDTCFKGEIVEITEVSGIKAVVPRISGQAWITGIMQYGVDPTDPFQEGHQVADVWQS